MHVVREHGDLLPPLRLDTFEGVAGWRGPFVTDHGAKRDVFRAQADGVTLFIKRIRHERLKDRIYGLLFLGGAWSSARREWNNYMALQGSPISSASPVSFGERGSALKGESYIITEAATGTPLDAFLVSHVGEPRRRQRILGELATRLRQMHDAGIAFPDLFARHVFVDESTSPTRFSLIDVSRLDRLRHVDARRRARDLAALHVSLPLRYLGMSDRLRFLRAYDADMVRPLFGLIVMRSDHLLTRRKFSDFATDRPTVANALLDDHRRNPVDRWVRSAVRSESIRRRRRPRTVSRGDGWRLPPVLMRGPSLVALAFFVVALVAAVVLVRHRPLSPSHGHALALNLIDIGNDGTPDGFSLAMKGDQAPPQTWKPVDGGNGRLVLSGRGAQDPHAGRFPVLLYDRLEASDVAVTVRFRADSEGAGRAAGVVVRYQSDGHYYVARASAANHQVALVRMDADRQVNVAHADGVTIGTGQWHTLTLDTRGTEFRIWLDGQLVLDAEDRDNDGLIDRPGKVGLWTAGDALTMFDGMSVDPS